MTIQSRLKAFATNAIIVGAIGGYGQASGQDCRAELAGAQRVESKGYVLAYRTEPEKIKIGEHFAIDLVLCAKEGGPEPASVRVDASMPEHRHGMNYRPSVTRRGPHQHRAEGLLLHMPGRWEFAFDVHGAPAVERLTHSVTVR
ncbi:MAG: hypothetical protein ACKVQT_12755 [Burkholderiales bacterium]